MRGVIQILIAVVIILNLNLVIAEIVFGDDSFEIQEDYSPTRPLIGWVNVSLENEPEDSDVECFNVNMSLKEFLDINNYKCESSEKCSCFPRDCLPSFNTIGNSKTSETYFMTLFDAETIGMRLTGDISEITSFGFNTTTNFDRSCFVPFIIDVLGDGAIEYRHEEVSSETCFIEKPYGCFNLGDSISSTTITETPLCQVINLPPMRGFEVGAVINGTGNQVFTMTLDAGGVGGTCDFTVVDGGMESCDLVLEETLTSTTDAEVCIFAAASSTYTIKFEDNETCGYTEDSQGRFDHDFEIFARPLRYESLTDYGFKQTLLSGDTSLLDDITNYINEKYAMNCDPECVIPVKFHSGIAFDLDVYNLNLGYKSSGLEQTPINSFYELNVNPALISTTEFLQLDLDEGEFLVPSVAGEHPMIFKIGDKEITQDITVKDFVEIRDIVPKNPSLLVPTYFIILLAGGNDGGNFSYEWDFGDGTFPEKTKENKIQHTYTNLGSYDLTVNISTNLGKIGKTFIINVATPYDAINETINHYRNNLLLIDRDINKIPSWISDRIELIEDLDGLRGTIERLERNYKETFRNEDEELLKIMNELVSLQVPNKLSEGQVVKSSSFAPNKERFDPFLIGEFGAGSVNEDEDEYFDIINKWNFDNMEISYETKDYFFQYDDDSVKEIISHVKIVLTPKRDVEEYYVIIEGDTTKIKFLDKNIDVRDIDDFTLGIRYSELPEGTPAVIEFLHPQKLEVLNLPFYFSPEFRNLEFGIEPGICNYNTKCEKNLGENYKNCRNDCKPIVWTMVYLGILLFISLTIYIFLQEWYKKHYEESLFKNKNQLFNLISFMSVGVNNKMKKEDIFKKLESQKWKKEQLEYAWKKLHGKRTGMWEIPIFIGREKKKVKEELEKRKRSMTQGANLVPASQLSKEKRIPSYLQKKKPEKKGFLGLFKKKEKK